MSIFTICLIACAAMCVIMACGVVFDSKTWNSSEHVGLFVFHHKWVEVICLPMIFIVPLVLVFYALFLPMDAGNMFVQLILRILLGGGLLMASVFTFMFSSMVFFGIKHMFTIRKNVRIAGA